MNLESGPTNVKRLSYSMGYMVEDFHINILNIRGMQKKISSMSPAEKNRYLRDYSRYINTTNHANVFHCNYNKPDTVLFHAIDSTLVYFGGKIERLFVPKFYHHKNTLNFLKELEEYVREFDTVDKTGFSEYPAVLGRKLYEYKKPVSRFQNISIRTSYNDWPFPDTYFNSIGCTL